MVDSVSSTIKSFPILVIGSKTVAMFDTGTCNSVVSPNTAMSSTHLFTKFVETRDSILLTDTQIDFK